MKKFLISIDTEGDNLWAWRVGDKITTENAKYLPRFQELCESYGFKPTYLTNYEMATDPFFINYFKQRNLSGKCEIGMHLHAWNSPPEYQLPIRADVEPGAPYLIEYPDEAMFKKVEFMTRTLENAFEQKPVTHRAGRWATNSLYFNALQNYGYKIDCSVTPGMDWSHAPGQSPDSYGSNYTTYPKYPYVIEGTDILEVPVTVRENHRLKLGQKPGLKKTIKKYKEAKKGHGPLWLRPRTNNDNLEDLLYLADLISKDKNADYLMFMLHSSEFMPGGSPTFQTEEAIESLYSKLNVLFERVSLSYTGSTLMSYYKEKQSDAKKR